MLENTTKKVSNQHRYGVQIRGNNIMPLSLIRRIVY